MKIKQDYFGLILFLTFAVFLTVIPMVIALKSNKP